MVAIHREGLWEESSGLHEAAGASGTRRPPATAPRARRRRRLERITLGLLVAAGGLGVVAGLLRPGAPERVVTAVVRPGEGLIQLVSDLEPTANGELRAWQLARSLRGRVPLAGAVLRVRVDDAGSWSASCLTGCAP